MIDIALQVDHRWSLVQNALLIALLNRACHLAHIFIAFAQEHVIADADDFSEKGDHSSGFPDRLAMRNLGFYLIQFRESQSQSIHCRGKAEAGARRIVAENGNRQARVKHPEWPFLCMHLG